MTQRKGLSSPGRKECIDHHHAAKRARASPVLFLLRGQQASLLRIALAALLMMALALGHEPAFPQIPVPKPVMPLSPSKPSPPEKKEEPPAAPATPQPIPLTDIAVLAEQALSRVRQIESRSRIDDVVETASEELPVLAREVLFRTREMRQLLTRNTPLETVRSMEEVWRQLEQRTSALTRDLTRAALQLDRDVVEINTLMGTWEATRSAAIAAGAPAEVLDRVNAVSNTLALAQKRVSNDRARVLALQSRAAEINARAIYARQMLAEARERAVTRLAYRDSPPLWSMAFWEAPFAAYSREARENLSNQSDALSEYMHTHASRIVLHGMFFLTMLSMLSLLRRKVDSLCETDGELQRSRKIFDMPVVAAMLVSLLFSHWFYPHPPRALWVLISAIGAAPVMVFARRVIGPDFHLLLYAIVAFYLAERLRGLFAPLPGIARLMFLVESLLMIAFIVWALHVATREIEVPQWARQPAWRAIRVGAGIALALMVLAFVANIGGYVRLADLITRTVVSSAYSAVVLYALTRVGEGLLLGLLHVPPICMLSMVRRHRMILIYRINRWLKWLAFFGWLGMTLQVTGLLQPLIAYAKRLWEATLTIGSLTASVGDIFSFFFIIWAAYTLSRLVRFILEEEVYPNVHLDRGLPYAVSTMLHYTALVTGAVLALGALGVNMTKLTIVAGALTVGIGFGLQNIVNNFVSGLIILFERPIKVGDTIQIDDIIGRVEHIGIRASIVHATTGAEVIIPNGKLISDKVINWTLSNQLRLISVPVVTKPDIDVSELKEVLLDIARKNKRVVPNPPPEVLFIKRAIDTLEFELRVWTDDLDNWLSVKSDLFTAINEALKQKEMAARVATPAVPASAAAPAAPAPR